jgi:hypothetical protein
MAEAGQAPAAISELAQPPAIREQSRESNRNRPELVLNLRNPSIYGLSSGPKSQKRQNLAQHLPTVFTLVQ